MIFPDMPSLLTPRLELRLPRLSDGEDFFKKLGGSAAVARYMLWQPHETPEESRQSIQKALARYEGRISYRWAVTHRQTGELMGIVDLLRFDPQEESCSFAYMLAEEYWGKGYGTEVLQAVFAFGFREMGLKRISADHFAENIASGRAMVKAGMTRTGTAPGQYEKDGISHDATEYAITREDWQKNRSDPSLA